MTDVVSASPARRRPVLGRAVLLAGLGAGFWLLGQAGASADEGTALPLSAVTADVLAPVVSDTGEAVSTVPSTAADAASPVTLPEPPVAAAPPPAEVAPLSAIAPPVAPAVDLVRDVTAPVGEPATTADVVDLGPVLDLIHGLLGTTVKIPGAEVPTLGERVATAPTAAAPDGSALEASGSAAPVAVDDVRPSGHGVSAHEVFFVPSEPSRGPAVGPGRGAPSPAPGTPADAPSSTACTGSSSVDQVNADLVASAASGDHASSSIAGADGATSGLPLDPSSSPD